MPRKLNLTDVERYDASQSESHVRWIEMQVDGICDFEPLYVVQYFRDARLYSLAEAWRYLDNFIRGAGRMDEGRIAKMAELASYVSKLEEAILKK